MWVKESARINPNIHIFFRINEWLYTMSLSLYFSAIAILVSLISFCWDYSLQQKVAKIQSEEHQFRLEELAEKNQLKITANELRKLQKSIKDHIENHTDWLTSPSFYFMSQNIIRYFHETNLGHITVHIFNPQFELMEL